MKKSKIATIILVTLIVSSCAGSKPKRPAKMKRSNWRRSKQAMITPIQKQQSTTYQISI